MSSVQQFKGGLDPLMNHLHKFHDEVMESGIGLKVVEKFHQVLKQEGFSMNVGSDKGLAEKNVKILDNMKQKGVFEALKVSENGIVKPPANGEMTELVELMNRYKKMYNGTGNPLEAKVHGEASSYYPKSSETPSGLTPDEVKKCLAAAFLPNAELLTEADLKKTSFPEQNGDKVRNVPGWIPFALLEAYRLRNLRPTWDKVDMKQFEGAADKTFRALIETFEGLTEPGSTTDLLQTPPSASDDEDKG